MLLTWNLFGNICYNNLVTAPEVVEVPILILVLGILNVNYQTIWLLTIHPSRLNCFSHRPNVNFSKCLLSVTSSVHVLWCLPEHVDEDLIFHGTLPTTNANTCSLYVNTVVHRPVRMLLLLILVLLYIAVRDDKWSSGLLFQFSICHLALNEAPMLWR